MTPEQCQPDRPLERGSERVMREACHTLNGSWGYDRDNHNYKDPALLVRMLKHLHLPQLAGRVRYAQLLHDGSDIPFHEMDGARHELNNLAPPDQPAGALSP